MTCLVPPQRRFKAPLGPALPLCPPGSRAPFLARRASASRQLLSNPHQGHPPQTRCYWLTGSRLLYLFKRGWGGGGRMFLQVKGHVSCFAFPPNYLPKLGTLLCVCWVTGQQETRLQPQACRPQGGAPGVTPCARLQSPRVSEPVAAPETTTEGSFSLSGAVPAQPPRGRLFLFFFIPVFYKCIALF